MTLTYLTLFLGLGIVWLPMAMLGLGKAEDTKTKIRRAALCCLGWLASFFLFIGWGALECWYRGGCG
jgi:hypothetical protein